MGQWFRNGDVTSSHGVCVVMEWEEEAKRVLGGVVMVVAVVTWC